MLSPKTGRPPKDKTRDFRINLRLSEDELHDILRLSEKLSMTKTGAIVFAVQSVLVHLGDEG